MKHKPDSIQRFLLEEAHVRGEVAYLNATYQQIMSQRDYPPTVKRLLGESLVACVLLAETLKFKGSLSIQFQGDERLPLILVQCDDQLHLRGLAKFKPGLDEKDYLHAFMQGQMVFTIQSAQHTQNYQSQLPIDSGSIAQNIMHYFAQSEQIATFVWLAMDEEQAGGFLIQLLPSQETHPEEREHFWEYALKIGQTMTSEELFTLDNETLLYRLYHETKVRVFEPKLPRFQCRCTPEKMKQVLRVIGQEECQQLLSTYKAVDVHCEFCNQFYSFDSIDVAMVFTS
jgi:molecular chaperone Hsp33